METNETKTNETKSKKDNRVELFIPRPDGPGEQSVYIGINGKGYVIPKGQKVMVPPEVKEEYDRRNAAIEHLRDTRQKELEKSKVV